MTSEKRYPFLKLPDSVQHSTVIPVMLSIYKYGIAEIPSDMATLKVLEAEGLLQVNLIRNHSCCVLTDAGAAWVNKHLFQMLTECPLYLTYHALVVNDEIQLMKDIRKDVPLEGQRSYPTFVGPSMSMDRGRYFLQQINKGKIVLSDDCDVPYQLNVKVASSILVFRQDQLQSLEVELKKRFHPIRIKSLVRRLNGTLNTLTLTEWIEELYNRSYTKWRIGTDA